MSSTIDGYKIDAEFVPVEVFTFETYLDARRKSIEHIFDEQFDGDPQILEMRRLTDQAVRIIAEKFGHPFTIEGLTALADQFSGPYFVTIGVGSPLRVTDNGKLKCEVLLARERLEAKEK